MSQKLIYLIIWSLITSFAQTAYALETATKLSPLDNSTIEYYKNPDFSTLKPNDNLTLINLTGFQQTTDYTCGSASIVSLLKYYGRQGDEMEIAKQMGTSKITGTSPEQMVDWLRNNGFNVTWGENGTMNMLRNNIKKGIPTLVEWSDWGGHWVIAVGYDTRGTGEYWDDVIIFADPSDFHDDKTDGVTYFNAQRFEYMWFDALLFGRPMYKIYVTATPKATQ
jgi:hypothetical protein